MLFCEKPFTRVEFDSYGNVLVCCGELFKKFYSIGNIYDNNFDEIWNSDAANFLREKMYNCDFSLCKTDKCWDYPHIKDISEEEKNKKYLKYKSEKGFLYPETVFLSYDLVCQAKCIFCRDKIISNNCSNVPENFLEKISPVFENAKEVYLAGVGEVFYSEHSKNLLKQISKKYPNIKFMISTNGLLFNKKNITELGIEDKINFVSVSIHAATEETYKKIVRSGSFSIIKKNLEYLKELNEKGKIGSIQLVFVVCSHNYKEMPQFVEFANSYGFKPMFTTFFPRENNQMSTHPEDFQVHLPSNPLYDDFLNILKNPKISEENCFMQPILWDLKNLKK